MYKRTDNQIVVVSKNKNGPIQFCGSATYAASNIILNELKINEISLILDNNSMRSFYENGEVILEFDHKFKKDNFLFENDYFIHKDSGIFFQELTEKSELLNDNYLNRIISFWEKNSIDIHGACFFHYADIGSIRYFIPWHGRDEDYITGSIHQYLTPYISHFKKRNEQIWHQLSSSPGILYSKVLDDKVQIKGEVKYG